MTKTRITELPPSPIVIGTDRVVVIQNGKTFTASVSQLALAPIAITVDNIVGLNDALGEKVDVEDFDSKANTIHTHVANDITNATDIGKSILTANTANTVTALLSSVTSTSKGLIPSFGNVAANTSVTFTDKGWKPYDLTQAGGITIEANTTVRSIKLDVSTLTTSANITNFSTAFIPVYDTLSGNHLKISMDTFARKTHGHAISDITNLTTTLGAFTTKEANLSDITNGPQAVDNLGASAIGHGLFYANNYVTAMQTIGLYSGTGDISVNSINGASIGSYRSPIVNGAFNVWQRGTIFTDIGRHADGWSTFATGTNGVLNTTRETFTIGQTNVPGNPRYFLRLRGETFTATELSLSTAFEDVSFQQGQKATISFYTRSSVDRDIRVKVTQNFGSGGVSSTEVTTTVISQIDVSSTWKLVKATFTMPGIDGKLIGSNPNSDYIKITVLLKDSGFGSDIGTSYIDFANFQIEAGEFATKYEIKPKLYEDLLTKRYYQKVFSSEQFYANISGAITSSTRTLSVPMRTTPTASRTSVTATNTTGTSVEPVDEKNFKYTVTSSNSGNVVSESYVEFHAEII